MYLKDFPEHPKGHLWLKLCLYRIDMPYGFCYLCRMFIAAAGDRIRPTAWSPEIKRPKTEPSLSSHKNRDLSLPALVGEPEKFKVNLHNLNLSGMKGFSPESKEWRRCCSLSVRPGERRENSKISPYRVFSRHIFCPSIIRSRSTDVSHALSFARIPFTLLSDATTQVGSLRK